MRKLSTFSALILVVILWFIPMARSQSQNSTAHIISGPALPSKCAIATGDVFFLTKGNIGLYVCSNGKFVSVQGASTPFTWSISQFGGVPCTLTDCSTGPDSSVAFILAANACLAANGGVTTLPVGLFLFSGYTWHNFCALWGAGRDLTQLFLKANSNIDAIVSDVAGYANGVITQTWAVGLTGSNTGTIGGGFRDLSINGNAVNQSGAGPYRGINAYAIQYFIDNVRAFNTKGPCASFDFNSTTPTGVPAGTSSNWDPTIQRMTTDHCGTDVNNGTFPILYAHSHGFEIGGPTDFIMKGIQSYSVTGDNVFIGHNVGDMWMSDFHVFSPFESNIYSEAYGAHLFGIVEGAHNNQVNVTFAGDKVFANLDVYLGTPGSNAPGVQFGVPTTQVAHCGSFHQATPGLCDETSLSTGAATRGGHIALTTQGFTSSDLVFTGFDANNYIQLTSDHTGNTGLLYTGNSDSSDTVLLAPPIGLTCVHNRASCGGNQFARTFFLNDLAVTISGSVSGTATCQQETIQNPKMVTCTTANFSGTGTWTIPSAFTQTPPAPLNSANFTATATTTVVSLTGNGGSGSIVVTGN